MPDASTLNHANACEGGTGIGAQLQRARETAARSINDCAQLVGISARRYAAYEADAKEPTMPELEQLALYLQVSVDDLFGDVEIAPLVPTPDEAAEVMRLRARIIGAQLRKARTDRGEMIAATAQSVGMRITDLERFERAEKPLPIGKLAQLAHHLGLQRSDLLDIEHTPSEAGAPPTEKPRDEQQFEEFLKLPMDVREALLTFDALSYIRAGLRLRGLRGRELRRAGKALDKLASVVRRG